MGSDNSKPDAYAYPHQQYEYDVQQQVAKQQATHKAKTHHHHQQCHKHAHHGHHHHTHDVIQPKPQPPPPPQPQVIQYVAVPQQIQPQTIPQQPIPIQQTLANPATVATVAAAQTQIVRRVVAPSNAVVPTATGTGVVATNPNTTATVQLPQQQQQQFTQQALAPTAAIAATAVIAQQHIEYKQPPIQATQYAAQPMPQYAAQPMPPPIPPGYIQIKGADGKQYIVPRGPPGTIPMVVGAAKTKPKVLKAKKKYKTWSVRLVPTSERAKRKVRHHEYQYSKIVIGIVCDGDKYDGYNKYGGSGYGGYGHSNYGDLDRQKFVTMKVKVTDKIAIQQNTQKHYLEFWKNGKMYHQVIALDMKKKFQIRVGSSNHDYDVKLY